MKTRPSDPGISSNHLGGSTESHGFPDHYDSADLVKGTARLGGDVDLPRATISRRARRQRLVEGGLL